MKLLTGLEFARVLERRDWVLARVRGSHHIYSKPGSNVRLSVPIHGNKQLKPGLQRGLMRAAELTEDDLA